MTIDLERYRSNMPGLEFYWRMNKEQDVHKTISMYSAFSGVPAIVVAYYMLELTGESKIMDIIVDLKQFYGYNNVIGGKHG